MNTTRAKRASYSVSITIPNWLVESINQFLRFVSSLPSRILESVKSISIPTRLKNIFQSNRFAYFNRRFGSKLPKIILLIFVIIFIGIIVKKFKSAISSPTTTKDGRIVVKDAKAKMDINKEYSFPLLDGKGKNVATIKFNVESTELRDEIIVKGQRATAVAGRTFLIVPIKITNTYEKALEINARDYVRLVVNGNDKEQLAADIHNDPVSVQALSTKSTRLGFPINDTDKNLVLRVGELNGNKEPIALKFP